MRFTGEGVYEVFDQVDKVAKAYIDNYRAVVPSDELYIKAYDHFTNWLIAIIQHPYKEDNMDYVEYCVRHGFETDMPGALAEFISQCNLLGVFGGPFDITIDEYHQMTQKIDWSIDNHTIQVKAVCVFDSKVRIYKDWWKTEYAEFHSLIDIDMGHHWLIRTNKLIELLSKCDKSDHPVSIDTLDEICTVYFDNSHIYQYNS